MHTTRQLSRVIVRRIILLALPLCFVAACSGSPTEIEREEELSEGEEILLNWRISEALSHFGFEADFWERQEASIRPPDVPALLQRLPWGELEASRDLYALARDVSRHVVGAYRVSPSAAQPSSSATRSTADTGGWEGTITIDDAAAHERFESVGSTAGGDLSLAIGASFGWYVCWSEGEPDRTSLEIEFSQEAEVGTDRVEQHARVEIDLFTNHDLRIAVEVTVDDHRAIFDSGRIRWGSLGPWIGEETARQISFPRGRPTVHVDYASGATFTLTCPLLRCSPELPARVEAAIITLLEELVDEENSLLAAMEIAVAVPLIQGQHYELKDRDSYCLDVSVAPEYAELRPNGDELTLTVSVRDWYGRPLVSSIVTIEGVELGTITPVVAPTGTDGDLSARYVSGAPGVENLRIPVRFSFYERVANATLVIGKSLAFRMESQASFRNGGDGIRGYDVALATAGSDGVIVLQPGDTANLFTGEGPWVVTSASVLPAECHGTIHSFRPGTLQIRAEYHPESDEYTVGLFSNDLPTETLTAVCPDGTASVDGHAGFAAWGGAHQARIGEIGWMRFEGIRFGSSEEAIARREYEDTYADPIEQATATTVMELRRMSPSP